VPEAALTPREGATMAHLTVPTDEAIGLESAEMIVPYPPGVPLLVAGELISTEVVESMRQLLAAGCRMVGLSDPTGKTLRCVDD
jgi:arginine/lysine/ornithine decarboxylase